MIALFFIAENVVRRHERVRRNGLNNDRGNKEPLWKENPPRFEGENKGTGGRQVAE